MKSILIVDDNKDILDALAVSFCRSFKECSILSASSGEGGEHILKSSPVDLVLTELSMTDMNGYKFIEQVKKDHPFVPLCVMTGDCSPAVIKRLELMGVGRWIEKPFQFDKLAAMISEELGLDRADCCRTCMNG